MKKFVTLVLSLLMMLPLASGVMAKDAVSYNLSDVTNALKYVAGWGDGYYNEKYDYNTDNKVSIFDAACMLKVIAGWDEDNICLKKPTDEFIRQIEAEISAWIADHVKHYEKSYDAEITHYYGTYNGAVAIIFESGAIQYSQAYTTDYVAGYEFGYGDGNTIVIWKDGKEYYMELAYKEGVLTKEQIKRIYELHEFGGYIKY